MAHEYVEVNDAPGCVERVKDSIAKVGIGLVMLLIAFPLIFWNEGRAVKRAEDLEFGKGAVVEVEADKVDAANEGGLVHLSGDLAAKTPAEDAEFGISTDGIALRRKVEMYQWKETKKKETKGDKEITRYVYDETWNDSRINSGTFNVKGYDNPEMPAEGATYYSPDVRLGAYAVDAELVQKWPVDQEHVLTEEELGGFPEFVGFAPKLHGKYVYFGDPETPIVGDVRISYLVGTPGPATAVTGLSKGTLTEYANPDMNGTIGMLRSGTHTSVAMFQAAEDSNVMMTWILRLVGFLMIFGGFSLVFGPLSALVRRIPLVGAAVEFGTTLLAGLLAAPLTLITIGLGWIFYSPLLGILLFLVAGAFIGGAVYLAMKARKKSGNLPQTA